MRNCLDLRDFDFGQRVLVEQLLFDGVVECDAT
jgi:hypothetical protein